MASLKSYLYPMKDLEIDSSANLYAFVSESRKEHNFVKHKVVSTAIPPRKSTAKQKEVTKK